MDRPGHETARMFVGTEIEKTPALGKQTLFVVGVHAHQSILEAAGENYCTHIYFGANQSFPKLDFYEGEWDPWQEMIHACLDAGYWCTLDFDVACVEGVLECSFVTHRRFIPQISVKLPYLSQLGYNATIKIDDKDFEATNPGVWCHRLHELTTTATFTDWDTYKEDKVI